MPSCENVSHLYQFAKMLRIAFLFVSIYHGSVASGTLNKVELSVLSLKSSLNIKGF